MKLQYLFCALALPVAAGCYGEAESDWSPPSEAISRADDGDESFVNGAGDEVIEAQASVAELEERRVGALSGDGVLLYCGNGGNCREGLDDLTNHYVGLGLDVDRLVTLPGDLSNYRLAFVILPTEGFTAAQVSTVDAFVRDGGRLVLVSDFRGFYHGHAVLNGLLTSLDVPIRLDANIGVDLGCDQFTANIVSDQITEGVSLFEYGFSDTVTVTGDAKVLISSQGAAGQPIVAVGQPPGARARPGADVVVAGDSNSFTDLCAPVDNATFWTNLYVVEQLTPSQPEVIIDNHDDHQALPPEVSLTGTWEKATGATEQFGLEGFFAHTGGEVDTYRFTPELTGSSDYRVMVWNSCFSPRANNVPHTIVFDGGSVTVEVDQDCNTGSHGEWLELGVFPFAEGSGGFLEVSDVGLAPGSFISVEGVRFLREDVILIENDDPETSFTGEWSEALAASENHGLSSLFARGDVASSYRFTPTIATAGDYEVLAWNSCFSPRENNVPHTVAHADGSTTIEVDQDCNTGSHGEFHSLGVFRFAAGASGFVEISNANTSPFGNVGVDAVLFVPAP